MIVGIGTDLVEIRRMRDMMDRHRGLERIFTKNELAHAKDRADVLAGTFAVKEAVSKAFGTGFFGAEPYEIEVLRNEKGAPYVRLTGRARRLAETLHMDRIHVSITDTKKYAQAFVIGECL
ncbi:holo-ACP synthase [Anaerostipes butyraticus]|uniref:holo-ACP synthase n=1 Tax=Anaerostipes butyraticus TaxID=645466 RepID=UPI003208C565